MAVLIHGNARPRQGTEMPWPWCSSHRSHRLWFTVPDNYSPLTAACFLYYCDTLYPITAFYHLTHSDRVTHICVSELTAIGSDNCFSPGRRQVIIRTNAETLLIGHPRTNLSEILIEIHTFSFKKVHFKMWSAKWRPFRRGLSVLTHGAIWCTIGLFMIKTKIIKIQ